MSLNIEVMVIFVEFVINWNGTIGQSKQQDEKL